MVVAAYVKDPNAVKDYSIDWSSWLATGDTVTASTWTAPAGITIGSGAQAPSFTTTKTTVWLQGGTAGTEYLIVNHITTAQGRQDDQTIIVLVLEV